LIAPPFKGRRQEVHLGDPAENFFFYQDAKVVTPIPGGSSASRSFISMSFLKESGRLLMKRLRCMPCHHSREEGMAIFEPHQNRSGSTVAKRFMM
jgi:hypothetical protein